MLHGCRCSCYVARVQVLMLCCTGAGADCLAKGAQALEEAKPAEAMAMLEAALEVYDTEAKGLQALDVYR